MWLEKGHFERNIVFQSQDFSRVFAVSFRARLIKRANLKHLFPSRSPKPNKFYVSLKLVANWDGFSMKIFSLNHTSTFLCKISSPHTWTKTPLNIGILAAPFGRFYLFILKVWRFGLGFSLKERGGWYGDMLLTCQPWFLCSRKFRSMVNMVGPQVVGWWKWCHCKYSCCFFVCYVALPKSSLSISIWCTLVTRFSRNSRWFQKLYVNLFFGWKKTQFSLIKSKVSWAWCHWSQQ